MTKHNSSYLPPEEYNRLAEKEDEYISFATRITSDKMDKAEQLINEFRELHREITSFVAHTCLCGHDYTIWRFLYKFTSVNDEEYISQRRTEIFNRVFAEEIVLGNASTHDYFHPVGAACVCPFSVR